MRISEFRMRRRVRFYEVDGAGIVHFSCYFRYMEEAEYELWRSAGLRAAALPGIGLPRVAASFDYRRPLRFEDEFEARIRITSIGEKSIAYSCALTLGEETIATGTMTIACVRIAAGEPMRAIPWPVEIAERLEEAPSAG